MEPVLQVVAALITLAMLVLSARRVAATQERIPATVVGQWPAASNAYGGVKMDWDMLEGRWNQFKGAVREKWGDLTDDDLDRIHGNREQFVGRLQERYAMTRSDAERDVDEFVRDLR